MLHALVIGGLNIFMTGILENINAGASHPGYRRVKDFYDRYFRKYLYRGFMPWLYEVKYFYDR